MKLRFGRFGAFLGCTNYPECKGIVNIPKKGEPLPAEMPSCPAIGCDGKLSQRRSRFGKTFFSCSNYPDCDVIVNSLDDLETKYVNHPKTAYVKKAKTGKGGKKAGSSLRISDDLKAVIGDAASSRGEVTKKLWEYIKKHNLQDPKNKRKIVPDAKLAKVFGSKKPIDMMELAKLIGQHLK